MADMLLEEIKSEIRKLPRYSSINRNAVLYPDATGELVEIGSVLSLLNSKLAGAKKGDNYYETSYNGSGVL